MNLPRKFPSNSKQPSIADTRTISGKKKNPPTTPLSPNANGRLLDELAKTFSKDNTKDESLGPNEINHENDYAEVNFQGTDDKVLSTETTKRKKEQKKKKGKQKEDQDKEAKRQKSGKKKSRYRKEKKVPARLPQVKRPPIEECVTGDETVPLFVIKCVEFLEEEGLCQEGIYRIPGKGADSDLITSTFLKDDDINLWEMGMSVPAVCTALKQFFSKLPEPLIPYGLQKDFLKYCTGGLSTEAGCMSPTSFHFSVPINTQNQEEQTRAIKVLLEQMPRIKKETLEYMMLHLNKIMKNFQHNKMNSQNLAICWLITLMHTNCETFQEMQKIPRLTPILEQLISQPEVFFPGYGPSAENATCDDETGSPEGLELDAIETREDSYSANNIELGEDTSDKKEICRTEVVTK
ncbi:rho GTPase-activating protein 5-like [Anneissia japonica]|uniref:rho GTPase-activating protein 5-like n=1 Tax=Anneissia japonica TaxID=1529436 RepID=UPI0014255B52|nr:rho GTPase-activating protein 5-like [Anneissia japonica]